MHGARRGIDRHADETAEKDVAEGHVLKPARQHSAAIEMPLFPATHGDVVGALFETDTTGRRVDEPDGLPFPHQFARRARRLRDYGDGLVAAFDNRRTSLQHRYEENYPPTVLANRSIVAVPPSSAIFMIGVDAPSRRAGRIDAPHTTRRRNRSRNCRRNSRRARRSASFALPFRRRRGRTPGCALRCSRAVMRPPAPSDPRTRCDR